MTNVDLEYRPRQWQKECHADRSRFRVLALHRRAGKTVLATMELIDAALQTKKELALYAYIAPYLSQSKSIAWGMMKFRLRKLIELEAIHVNEAELTITFLNNGAKIRLFGGDNYDALRGVRLDGVVMDEVGNMHPELWEDVVQAALSDRKGFALFIGTPSGVNMFSEKYFKAKTLPDWSSRIFTVYDTEAIDADEVVRLRRDMSEASFEREYMCNFSASGEDQLISLDDVETASKRIIKIGECDYAPKIIGVDIARFGDDSSVIQKRQGFHCFDPIAFHGINNMELANQVIYHINEWQPDAVFLDAGGGAGVIDRIRQLGHDVIEVPFGGKSADPKCSNKRSEMHCNVRDWIKEGGAIPNHMRLKQDLATPRYWYDKFNRIIIEPKDDIKARGLPSPDFLDALCFVKNTMIATPKGDVAIQDIKHGDIVCTPFGDTKVKLLWKNETSKLATVNFSNGNKLSGTPNHNVFVWGFGEKRLDALTLTDVVSVYGQRRLLWKFLKALSILGVDIQFKRMVDITKGQNATALGFFTAMCGLIISEKYQKIMTFITRMTAGGTMNQIILNQSVCTNTGANTPKNAFDWEHSNRQLKRLCDKLLNGMDQKKEVIGIASTRRNNGKTPQQKRSNAKIVEKITKPIWVILNTALEHVRSTSIFKHILQIKENVHGAVKSLWQIDIGTQNAVQEHVPTDCAVNKRKFFVPKDVVHSVISYFSRRLSMQTTNVVPVDVQQENVHPTTVYNLTLEKHNAYYANGILVFNCLTFAHPVSVKNKVRVGGGRNSFTNSYDPLSSNYIIEN